MTSRSGRASNGRDDDERGRDEDEAGGFRRADRVPDDPEPIERRYAEWYPKSRQAPGRPAEAIEARPARPARTPDKSRDS